MRRYWWTKDINNESDVLIEGDLFKHIFKVCRRRIGDHFELLNDKKAYLVRVVEVRKKEALVQVKSSRELPKLKKPHLHLVLSFSQPKVIDKVLEKSVELGVKSLRLVATENSFAKDLKTLNLKTDRASKIVTQAMQQSGRGEVFDLKEPLVLKDFIERFRSDEGSKVGLMFYEGPSKASEKLLEDLKNQASDVESVYILIGSEGGFAESEALLMQNSGFKVLSLGDQILRVETACVASISILKSSFGIW